MKIKIKWAYLDSLAVEAEEAAHCGNIELFGIVKSDRPVKDKNGALVAREEGQRKRWVEYFEEQLLNRPTP